MPRRTRRRLAVVLLTLGVLLTLLQPVHADGRWTTKGGQELRTSFVSDELGLMKAEDWWQADLGQSATQPVVMGNTIYHLAGAHLWRIDLNDAGQIVDQRGLGNDRGFPIWVNTNAGTDRSGPVKVSSSSPTFSPKGIIYFGTAFGRLWAYNTNTRTFKSQELSGCPIVSSPLVLTIDGREVVIVGDKAPEDCPGGGSIWAVWGLDGAGEPARARLENGDINVGSWATPSPVKGDEEDVVIVGSDGDVCRGRATGVRVVSNGHSGFRFNERVWTRPVCDSQGGLAGSFASDGTNAYWVDTSGALWKRTLSDGTKADKWPDSGVNIPTLIVDGARGFTNTEPALDLQAGPGEANVYVTLRNYWQPGDSGTLRGCGGWGPIEGCSEPGAPGAIVAVKPDGTLAWYKRFVAADSALYTATRDRTYLPAINTAPLIIKSRNTVVFGDVNGVVHAYYLNSGKPSLLGIDASCMPKSTYPLLRGTEVPTRGNSTFSQVAGVGVDPALAGRMLYFGVNYRPPDGAPDDGKAPHERGRLVAIRFGEPYNLAWASSGLAPGGMLESGQPVTFEGSVALRYGEKSLGELRPEGVAVEWWVVDESLGQMMQTLDPAALPTLPGYKRRLGAQASLPGALAPGGEVAAEFPFTLAPEDPAKGFVVGVIDPDTLGLYDHLFYGDLVQALADWGGRPPRCFLGIREHAEPLRTRGGGDGFADNYTLLPYEKQMPLDLEVVVEAPAYVDWRPDGFYQVTVRHRNLSNTRVATPGAKRVLTQISTSLGTQDINRRPYIFEPRQEHVQTYNVPMGNCDSRSTVRATLNAANDPVEVNQTNNVAQVMTIIGPCNRPVSPPAGFQGGEGRSIIVPPDCIPNPDLTDPRVCTNYDKTLEDW